MDMFTDNTAKNIIRNKEESLQVHVKTKRAIQILDEETNESSQRIKQYWPKIKAQNIKK